MRSFSMGRRVPSRGIFIILLVKSDALRAGHQAEDRSWPENRKSCANVFICMLHVVALLVFVYTAKSLFFSFFFPLSFLWIWTPQGAAMLVHSVPVRSRKEQWFLMTWLMYLIFKKNLKKLTAHTSLVCSFVEMQTGTHTVAYGCVFATFRVWLLEKLSGKQKLCPFKIDPVMLHQFCSPLRNLLICIPSLLGICCQF